MKKLLAMSLMAFAAYGFAQDAAQSAQPGQTQQGSQPQQGAPAQQKVIKDPAEYNAYMSAISSQDPNQQAQSLEAYLQQYPNTVVKEEALEQLMADYQKAGNATKMTDAANRLLQVSPNNVRALALLVYFTRAQAEQQTSVPAAAQMYAQAAQYAQRGLQAVESATRPAGTSEADYKKLQDSVRTISNGAIGMDALQRKDYPTAQKALSAAVAGDDPSTALRDVYPLATAYLQATPPDYPNGLFWAAKAVNLAQGNPAAAQQIDKFAQYYYKKYHGSLDGWDQYKQAVQPVKTAQEAPPITPAPPPPTPCEFADTIMKSNPDVSQMAYGDWLFVLGSGNQRDADQVWTFLNGKLIPVSSPAHPAKVVSATPEELQLATTDDDIHDDKADVTLRMATPLAAAKVPQPGSMLAGTWLGKATSYNPLPPAQPAQPAAGNATQPAAPPAGCLPNTGGGVMLTLTEGSIKGATPPKRAPARARPGTARRRPAAH